MHVKFLEAREVKDGAGVVIQKFRAGQVVELSTASARHWINRNAATAIQGGKLPSAGPKGLQSKSEEGRFGAKAAKEIAPVEGVEEKPEVATGNAEPTSPKRGRGRPRSA